jgi:hypothetical protein
MPAVKFLARLDLDPIGLIPDGHHLMDSGSACLPILYQRFSGRYSLLAKNKMKTYL